MKVTNFNTWIMAKVCLNSQSPPVPIFIPSLSFLLCIDVKGYQYDYTALTPGPLWRRKLVLPADHDNSSCRSNLLLLFYSEDFYLYGIVHKVLTASDLNQENGNGTNKENLYPETLVHLEPDNTWMSEVQSTEQSSTKRLRYFPSTHPNQKWGN